MSDWSEIFIAGHAARLYEPAGVDRPTGVAVGLGGVAAPEWLAWTELTTALEAARLPCLAVWCGASWWTSWPCADFDDALTGETFITTAVRDWIGDRYGANVIPALWGIDIGGHGALRIAYRHARDWPIVAALAPAVDYHTAMAEAPPDDPVFGPLWRLYRDPEQARQDSALLHLRPLNWPRQQWIACDQCDYWWEGADRLRMKLNSTGIPVDFALDTAASGTYDRPAHLKHQMGPLIAWVADRIEVESRRR